MISVLRRLFRSQRAATVIEYSLIACLISIVAVGTFTTVGQKVMNMLGPAANALT
jgi:Flp pilus assembly pilin Flp